VGLSHTVVEVVYMEVEDTSYIELDVVCGIHQPEYALEGRDGLGPFTYRSSDWCVGI
jgi:hypothetical protein